MKVSDEELSRSYAELQSVWKVGKRHGISGQSAHERLFSLGLTNPVRVFTEEERDRIRREYSVFKDAGKLQELADAMGRTKPFICRQARALGLTNPASPKKWNAKWKYLSDEAMSAIWEDFKSTRTGLGEYCKRKGYDALGFSVAMKRAFEDEYEIVIESKASKTSPYRLGRALEYRVKEILKKNGYFSMRSAGSKSPIDVLGIRPGVVLFIQCKRSGAIGVKEWNIFYDLCLSCGATPLAAMKDPSGSGTKFMRMTGRKANGKRARQPWEEFCVSCNLAHLEAHAPKG